AFGNHALPFAKEIGQQAGKDDRNGVAAVGHREADLGTGTAHAALFDKTAEPKPRAGRRWLFDNFSWRAEKDDRVVQRGQHERGGSRENGSGNSNQKNAAAFPRHAGLPSSPSASMRSDIRLCAS